MNKKRILVTGKSGQLGTALQNLYQSHADEYDFLFAGRNELDLLNEHEIEKYIVSVQPDYCINCAAYTAVDKAESEKNIAYAVNATAVGAMAKACKQIGAKLITISTDYVFNGLSDKPYTTQQETDPVNYYGFTKREGELLALQELPETIVIRTSWVYGVQGNNFVKTMLRLMKERDAISVVNDQVGAPTYANDLAAAIIQIIKSIEFGNVHYGIYHYSNEGIVSWFDFAVAIKEIAGLNCSVQPIPASAYPTPAKRPVYSVMYTTDIVRDFGVQLMPWQSSLLRCMKSMGI